MGGNAVERWDDYSSARDQTRYVTIRSISVVCVVEGAPIRIAIVAVLRCQFKRAFDPSVVAGNALTLLLRDEAMYAVDNAIVLPYRVVRAFKVLAPTDGRVRQLQDSFYGYVGDQNVPFRQDEGSGRVVMYCLVECFGPILIRCSGLYHVKWL